MPEPLAPYELEAIQARHEEATEGPWWFDESEDCWRLHGVGQRFASRFGDQIVNKQILKAPKHGTPYAEYWPDEADAAFIVNAHEDMRRLLAEVDHRKAETGGAAVAEQEPVRIAPTVFMVETEENVGATLLRMIDQDGREVYVGLDDHMRDLLVSMLVRNDGAADADPIAPETLAEIRRRDEIDLRAADKPDGSLDETAWERHVLLTEVDRLKAANARLEAQVSLLGSHLQRDALDVVDRLRAQAAEQAGQ